MRLYSKLAVWQIFMTCFFIDSFESRTDESKVPDRIRDGDVVRTKSNRVREGDGRTEVSRKTKREREELLFCRRSV